MRCVAALCSIRLGVLSSAASSTLLRLVADGDDNATVGGCVGGGWQEV